MPTFGDYETAGEPLITTNGTGHSSQIWLARKIGAAENRLFAIKIYTPRQRRRAAESSEESLEEDRALEFLEGVKHLKKAQSEGGTAGRRLTPIHEFGKTPEGNAAWYVTDFYGEAEPFLPASLQSYIMRGGRLDGGALRNIVHSVVTGCLALKRSRGFSHGNLKSSNVFRVGKSRPLRSTLLQLADSFPAAPMQLTALDPDYRESLGELLQQTMEVQDLRALGVLILQLVEGRLITTEQEYDYPVASSPPWDRLGKDAEHWREVCNRLLDPSLSLEQVNLETLEQEFRPSPAASPMALALVALVCLVALGGYSYHQWRKKHRSVPASAATLPDNTPVTQNSRPPPSQASPSSMTSAPATPKPPQIAPAPGEPTVRHIGGAIPPPQITEQPEDQTNYIGGNAILWASATGTGPLKYQWRFNGRSKEGATSASLTLRNLRATDSGSYSLTVSNDGGAASSGNAFLTVLPPGDSTGAALKDALRKGTEALGQTNLEEAIKHRNAAFQFKADDPGVSQLSLNIYSAALLAATNAVEGQTVNLDEAERNWEFLRLINPADKETDHVKSLIQIFDKLISQAITRAQAAGETEVKTISEATNLVSALDGTGVFDWRPSRTNATAKLIEALERQRSAAVERAFDRATKAVAANQVQEARAGLEIMKVLNPADARISTLQHLIEGMRQIPPP